MTQNWGTSEQHRLHVPSLWIESGSSTWALWPTCRALCASPPAPPGRFSRNRRTPQAANKGNLHPEMELAGMVGWYFTTWAAQGCGAHLPGEGVELATYGGSCTQHCPIRESWELAGAPLHAHVGMARPQDNTGLARLCSAHTQGFPAIKKIMKYCHLG